MYSIDSQDEVVELEDLPPSDAGAPLPLILADDHNLVLAYLVHESDPAWDGVPVSVMAESAGKLIALVEFPFYTACMFGPPNDEAFTGHPLAARGLSHYGIHEVRRSSWIRGLERMNAVHRMHRPDQYAGLRHFIFAFHDSTFECVSESLRTTVYRASLTEMVPEMQRRLGHATPEA